MEATESRSTIKENSNRLAWSLAGIVVIAGICSQASSWIDDLLEAGRSLVRRLPRDIPKPEACLIGGTKQIATTCREMALNCCRWMEEEEVAMSTPTSGRCRRVENVGIGDYVNYCHTLCLDAAAVCAEAGTHGMK